MKVAQIFPIEGRDFPIAPATEGIYSESKGQRFSQTDQ